MFMGRRLKQLNGHCEERMRPSPPFALQASFLEAQSRSGIPRYARE
jgi:hypothetical protein